MRVHSAVLLAAALLAAFASAGRSAQAQVGAPASSASAPEPVHARGEPRRIDGIAAVIGAAAPGPQTITILRSDVELRARLALLAHSSLDVALGPLPSGVLTASLAELVGEALIAQEASRLNLESPSAEARVEERARLIDSVGPDARELLKRLQVSDRELATWVERRAVVSGFLAANLEGALDVSNMELARLFRSEPHPFQGEPFEEARERFAEWLERDRTQRAVRRWVETLAERTPHRVLARYP